MSRIQQLLVATALLGQRIQADVGGLRWDQVQWVKTHNSYKSPAPAGTNRYPEQTAELHPSLKAQLDAGVRALELDLFLRGGPGSGAPDFDVKHMASLDDYSSCTSLTGCLGEIKEWVDANPSKGQCPSFEIIN